jgi:prolipoprotein diacylglyceryl transferase
MLFLSWLYWDPQRELWVLPFFNIPILWYSILFAVGFLIGYKIFYTLLVRYLLQFPYFSEQDVKDWDALLSALQYPQKDLQTEVRDCLFAHLDKRSQGKLFDKMDKDSFKKRIIAAFNQMIDSSDWVYLAIKEKFSDKKSSKRLFLESVFPGFYTTKQKASILTDRLTIYMVIATIVGARLGHLIFYENPETYIGSPAEIFKIWKGGLASHGAAVAILIALFFFAWSFKKFSPKVHWLSWLDLVAIPTAFAAVCIRVGNFFNQEILGKFTHIPWAVIFGHPADGSFPVPRHPVQIYEAIFYFLVFSLLYGLSFKPKIFLKRGKIIGLFLILVFSFRFLIEFIKEEQSPLLVDHPFLIAQYLSLPLVILGFLFFFWKSKKDEKPEKIM